MNRLSNQLLSTRNKLGQIQLKKPNKSSFFILKYKMKTSRYNLNRTKPDRKLAKDAYLISQLWQKNKNKVNKNKSSRRSTFQDKILSLFFPSSPPLSPLPFFPLSFSSFFCLFQICHLSRGLECFCKLEDLKQKNEGRKITIFTCLSTSGLFFVFCSRK